MTTDFFRSPHRNGKWHITTAVANDGRGVRVFIARCGTAIGSEDAKPVPTTGVQPALNHTCSKCLRKGRP